MSANYCKLLVAYLLGSFVLISCNVAQTEDIIIPTETLSPTPSPTTLPYWDLLPLDWDPDGGWTTLVLEESDISFQIPSVYQKGDCGELVTFYKDVANYKAHVIGFEGSRIQLHVFSEWDTDWEKVIKEGKAPQGISLVTSVERFSLGDIPAFRYITTIPSAEMLLYSKSALAYYHDKLYSFVYISAPYLPACDAYPISEEQVYEYLLSTVEFLE
jgi:hypothetical protein